MTAIRSALLFATGAAAIALAHAAPLSVAVTDAAGKPLADAVVLLEPASGKVAVKPLPDVEIAQAKRGSSVRA